MRPIDPRRARATGLGAHAAGLPTHADVGRVVLPRPGAIVPSGGILTRNSAIGDPPVSRTEHDEQCYLIVWVRANLLPYPDLDMLTAVPHAEQSKAQAGKKAAEGVSPGYPDLLLDVPRGGWYGLRIEMKRPSHWPSGRSSPLKAGQPRPAQDAWHTRLAAHGYFVATCWRWESARDVLVWYLGLWPTSGHTGRANVLAFDYTWMTFR